MGGHGIIFFCEECEVDVSGFRPRWIRCIRALPKPWEVPEQILSWMVERCLVEEGVVVEGSVRTSRAFLCPGCLESVSPDAPRCLECDQLLLPPARST